MRGIQAACEVESIDGKKNMAVIAASICTAKILSSLSPLPASILLFPKKQVYSQDSGRGIDVCLTRRRLPSLNSFSTLHFVGSENKYHHRLAHQTCRRWARPGPLV